jgi:hypothetical protein
MRSLPFASLERVLLGVDICKSVWRLMERVEVINVRAPVSGQGGAGAVLPPVKGWKWSWMKWRRYTSYTPLPFHF